MSAGIKDVKACVRCGTGFAPYRDPIRERFCSKSCRQAHWREAYREGKKRVEAKIATPTKKRTRRPPEWQVLADRLVSRGVAPNRSQALSMALHYYLEGV